MDLHLHTPASSDYQEPKVTYLDVLQTAEARGLDIIAFTDHNTVAGLRHLRDEIAELELLERLGRLLPDEAYRLGEYRRLLDKVLLLPGFEFTATFGFHIMGIFPPEIPVRDLEHLLLSLNVPREQLDRGAAAVGATTDVLTAYRLIGEAGGLAIAAHANSTNGVAMRGFGFGGQTKIAFTQDPNLCALEVTDLDQKGKRSTAAFFSGTKPEYPRRMHCITGSDAHRLSRDPHNSKNLGIGDRATDVLLDEVSFEALKELFQGSDFARVRPHTAGMPQAEFDPVQQARDEGPNIVQAFHESMQQRGGRLYSVVADVCAFANTNGGTIFVGVGPDPKQPPLGVPDTDLAARELKSALARLLTPQLECAVDVQPTRGKKVVRILVPRGEDAPYAIEDNKIYVREEAETSLAVRDEIVQLVLRGRTTPAPAAAAQAASAAQERPAEPAAAQPVPVQAQPMAEPATGRTPIGPPRTGVEIVASEDRDGVRYHTMRDLRNGSVVKNVTRTSARKLWHYAITAKETGALNPSMVTWSDNIGLWRKTHKGGQTRYDLVQRAGGELHVYYGVTEDGIHGPWKRFIESEERRLAPAAEAPAANGAEPPERAGEVLPEEPAAGLVAAAPEVLPSTTLAEAAPPVGEAPSAPASKQAALAALPESAERGPQPPEAEAQPPADEPEAGPAVAEPAADGKSTRKSRPRSRSRSTKKTTAPAKTASKPSSRSSSKSTPRPRARRPASGEGG